MTKNYSKWAGRALVLAAFVAAWLFRDRVPDPVPVHWNMHGMADSFMPKPWGLYLLPLTSLFLYALMALLPVISPKRFRMDGFPDTFEWFRTAMTAFFFVITLLALSDASGLQGAVQRGVPIALGLFFVAIGGLLPKIKKNFFIGIRTPWTLSSEKVWARTHQLAGRVFVAMGLVTIAGGWLRHGLWIVIGVILVSVLSLVLYSFLLYRRLEGLPKA